jgi:hypothetical protein
MLRAAAELDRSNFTLAEDPRPAHAAMPRKAFARALMLATASGTAYGAWALFANRAHGLEVALRSGLAQCATSFASTFLMVVILERLFALGRTPTRGFWTAAIGTTAASASLMATAHAFAGTPRILVTIAPLVAIACGVYTSYAWGLRRAALRG